MKLLRVILFFACTAAHAATVNVDSRASGGFGELNNGWQDAVLGWTFTQAGEQIVIRAGGQINGGAGGVAITGPEGFPGPVDNNFLLTTNYAPTEEQLVESGALVLPRPLGSTVPHFQGLFAAFVPEATASSPNFRPRDPDLLGGGLIGIPSNALFYAGPGPKLFTAPGPGRLYFGINDTFCSNNTGAYVVTLPDAPPPAVAGPLVISEFLADNETNLADEDGDFSDWIEIYNPSPAPVALAGYQLTDGSSAWAFPALTLAPQQSLVVFASGKNRAALPGPLHTNFSLNNAGEYLALKDPGGVVVSEFAPTFGQQYADISYGRNTAGELVFFQSPTPAAPNGAFVRGFVADTVFSVKRGFFSGPISVAITTATPGATIRYTLNGSVPTETNGADYTAPLAVSTTTTLRVRAFKPEWLPTNTDTNTYVFPADVLTQTAASAQAYGWPAGPINGQILRYGLNPTLTSQYTNAQMIAALTDIPTFSIVTEQAHLTGAASGIYVNGPSGGPSWERPASVELIYPDGTVGFQEDCGIRIRGGQSRNPSFPKHSFHLFFRKEYGAGKLKFPLFGAEGAKEFDTIDLRCEHGYAYADPLPYAHEFTAVRDITCRDLWLKAGHPSTRSKPYHLYINGQYWGLYQTQERGQEDFAAEYLGGQPEDYDQVAATGLPQLTIEVGNGDLAAWTQLWQGARAVSANPTNANYFALLGRNADGTPNTALPVLLDPDHLAAYMLLHYYCGHSDEPLSVSFNFEKPNNFRAVRRRGMTQPWRFIVHDGESSIRAPEWVDNRANAVNLTSPNRNDLGFSNPEWMHEDLLANAEYRVKFGDVAQRLLRNDGAFTAAKAQPVFDQHAADIDGAVIGESIRWGQTSAANQANWAAKIAEIRAAFFPTRSATVIAQLRQRNLFPSIDPPAFSQRGGQIAIGYALTLSAGAGTIYYTLDGTDPRAIGGAPAGLAYGGAITLNGPATVRVRLLAPGGEWSALDEAIFTTFPAATAANLIVSKVHYHPLPPTPAESGAGHTEANDFEYLELQNVSAGTIDLRAVAVSGGIGFTFAPSTLAAGARIVIAENVAAFTARYGAGLPVAGAYTGNLSDGGELLRVADATGATIAQFTYDDLAPWPLPPDGDGPALVLKAAGLDPALPTSWRASYSTGGKPGALDVLTLAEWRARYFTAAELADPAKEPTHWGDLADRDGDGFANLLEFALTGAPLSASARPELAASLFFDGGLHYLRLTYRIREGATGVSITPQVSGNLADWVAATTLVSGPLSQGDGTALVVVQDTVSLEAAPDARRFIRLEVTVPPP